MDSSGISERIKLARVSCGASQKRLAKILGVSRATVAHWERPEGFLPSTRRLGQVAQALEVSVEWLTLGQSTAEKEHATPKAATSRRDLEARMVEISRNIPASMLTVVVNLLEYIGEYLA